MSYNKKYSTDSISPLKITLEYRDDSDPEGEYDNETSNQDSEYYTDWSKVREQSKWFTEPTHLTENGLRKSETLDKSAIEEYVRTLDTMDNLRSHRDNLVLSHDRSHDRSRDGSHDRSHDRPRSSNELELSRARRRTAERLGLEDLEDYAIENQARSSSSSLDVLDNPYRNEINSLRLKSLRLEETRLLEVRRLQELERLRGPQPHWYELKTSQFHREARKNNEILAARKQWSTLRAYTEDVWKGRDISRTISGNHNGY